MNSNELISAYYAQHRDEIVGFIAVRIADADEAQDMVQDLFVRLLGGHQLISQQTLPSLVYTMARHQVADYYRRRRVRDEYEHYLQHGDDSDSSMESVFSARQLMEQMERSLARLSEQCRTVYRLHIYDGMKVGEIAAQLALPYKKVENNLGKARKAVRQHLRTAV